MEHPSILASADQEAKSLDQTLDCCIEACRAIKNAAPEFDEVKVRAVQISMMDEIWTEMPRLHLIALIATAVSRLA